MARPRKIPELAPEDPYAVAAAKVVQVRSRELFEHSDGILDTDDIERVHDMRVATRRLRAALEIFEPCFPKQQFTSTLSEVKSLADALGQRRDCDVAIAELEAFSDTMPAPDRRGVGTLMTAMRLEQRTANDALADDVSEQRLVALRELISELIAAAA